MDSTSECRQRNGGREAIDAVTLEMELFAVIFCPTLIGRRRGVMVKFLMMAVHCCRLLEEPNDSRVRSR